VLSGGGARGAAHIGVLKALEAQHVPIDAIAGTSVGAVVGGLYASGLSPAEIEALIDSARWRGAFDERVPRRLQSFRRKTEDERFLVKLPLGLNAGRFRLPKGLVSSQAVTQLLREVTAPVATIHDFDRLPIPFRAVTTDIESGASVVLGSGDLVTAMRASSTAPGVFAPVEIDGRLLVDGGLVDNLPVEVARQMGVDVLIVVDVGFPLRSRQSLDSAPNISAQMLSIMVRRGSDAQRGLLRPSDVLVSPALGVDDSTFDLGITTRAIGLGEQAAQAVATRLAPLAISADEFARHLASRSAVRRGLPKIDGVQVAADSQRYARLLETEFAPLVSRTVQPQELDAAVGTLFGRGNFESVDYRLTATDVDRAALEVSARRNSWGPNYVRFGLNLEDDFSGEANYNAAARFVIADISSLGAEWVWDFQVGSQPRIATEFHLPFGERARWFLMPQARFELRNVPLFDAGRFVADYRLRTTDYGLDVGREISNFAEVRAGVRSLDRPFALATR
jgi:NTE family protein